MKNDRFLTAILVGIAVLILAALVVFFWRKNASPAFTEDSPQGVLLRFLQAVEDQDYRQAYDLLAVGDDTLSYSEFRRRIASQSDSLDMVIVEIGDADIHDDEAWVRIWVTWPSDRPLLRGGNRQGEQALLVRQDGAWRLAELPFPCSVWHSDD